ncbi:MAG TPA: Asp/Glu/hydantoin racemase, partial [Ramlibacter sp.]
AERHLSIRDNHAFGLVPAAQLRQMIDEVAQARPQAIATYCTNLRAAPLAVDVERDLGIPLLDTVATTVWGMLRAAGVSPAAVTGWGGLFQWA